MIVQNSKNMIFLLRLMTLTYDSEPAMKPTGVHVF